MDAKIIKYQAYLYSEVKWGDSSGRSEWRTPAEHLYNVEAQVTRTRYCFRCWTHFRFA